MEATDQGATTTSQVDENIVVESGDQFTSYTKPLAQQPPVSDTYFHGPVEGRVDSPVRPDYCPEASFWGTSMGQVIASFGVRRPSPEHPLHNEE